MPVTPTVYTDLQYQTVQWVGETGTGVKAEVAAYSDITIQASGSGTLTVEGSNDGTNWVALKDMATGLALSVTVPGMAVLMEHPYFIRAVVTGGTATVTALASGNR